MALVPGVSEGALVELDVGNSAESPTALLNSQRELFHSQIEQLQKLVVAQCKLTGANPLSQEMVRSLPRFRLLSFLFLLFCCFALWSVLLGFLVPFSVLNEGEMKGKNEKLWDLKNL